jgi:hypothetical protein
MNAVLFLSLVIMLGAALWPKGTYGRSRRPRLNEKQALAYETKVFDEEALQKAAVKLKALDLSAADPSRKAAVQLRDGNLEVYPRQTDIGLIREFEEHWIARAT